jgi:Transcription antiterminator
LENLLEKKWYALYTKSRCEKKVRDQLLQQNFVVYLPLRNELRQWSDRKKMVEVPLISSYIFVELEPNRRIDVFNIPGLVAFVCDRGKPAVIPEKEIANMRLAVESKVDFELKKGVFNVGEMVRITSGPLTGVEGQIEQIRGGKKFYITIANVGFSLVLDLNDALFEKVTD